MTEELDKTVGSLALGRYRILRHLARGGMGSVYLARVEGAAGFARPVVVKRLLPGMNDPVDKKAQFVREAKILSNLRHPGIVNVIDFGKQNDAHIMVLEYVHGYHLGQWLKCVTRSGRRMPWEFCVLVMIQVLSALHYAHTYTRSDGTRIGIIHRDISPSNILIDIDGNVRLADFGIAHMDAEQAAQERTSEGVFKGKLAYAAPELFANQKATPATDIYACGVVLYQLLSGTNPFNAEDLSNTLQRVLALTPAPISAVREDVPPQLDEVLAKVLAKDSRQRYASAADLAAALRALLRHSEAEVAAAMNVAVREDFMGTLASMLDVQSLEELEVAWRRANSEPKLQILSSAPPTLDWRAVNAALHVMETPPTATVSIAAIPASYSNRRVVLVVVGTALLAAGIAATAVLLMGRPAPALEPRFVVVESRSDGVGTLAASTGSVERAVERGGGNVSDRESASAASTPSVSLSNKPARAEANPRDSGTSLSQIFAKRQAAIQRCFQDNATNMVGAPEVSIRFNIDAQGKVTSTAVRPAALSATALGQCLQGVASSTEFGPQEKPLVFSIPITARVR